MIDSKDRPELDSKQELGFCAFFKSMPPKPEGTIRLFERSQGDFYSCHGDDAVYISQEVYKTSTVIKQLGDPAKGTIPSVTLSRMVAESFLRDLLMHRQFKVEIWVSEGRKNNVWNIGKRGSPGNLQDFEDLLFHGSHELSTTPVVMAVKIENRNMQKVVGIAYANATSRVLGLCEFVDNDLFSNFETCVIQVGAKECLISGDDGSQNRYDYKKVISILDRCGVVCTERKKVEFKTKDLDQDLSRLLGDSKSVAILADDGYKVALSASSALITYLELLSDDSNFGKYNLEKHDLSQYMKLDSAAFRAMNLMPTAGEGITKSTSLYGLLNKCKTAQGSRLLEMWLKQPLLDLNEIEKRQNLVEAFCRYLTVRQALQEEHLKNMPDLHRLAKKFQRGSGSLQDVVRLYQAITRLPRLRDSLMEIDEPEYQQLVNFTFLDKLNKFIRDLEKFKEMVETTIDLERVENHEFLIKADFDQDLKDIRKEIDEVLDQISPEFEHVGGRINMEPGKKLKLERNSQYGYYLRLSRNDSSAIRGKKEFIELATQKNGVYFTTATLKRLSESYTELSDSYEKKQATLVKEVISIVATYCPVMELLNISIAHLDVLVAFADVSVNAPTPYVRPKMEEKGKGNIIMKAARHPCLEMQEAVTFIPNDVQLIRGRSEFQIITGPNMGGKSTYIRQIGVIVLLAQTGCFVPCSEATISVVDCILARVGAGDAQLKGVSTFMAEMLETASILKNATKDSIIIIDELGRGTSTYDGFGLAWSISEFISKEIKAFCLFATHFHELTALSKEVPSVQNLHVRAQTSDGRITLLYKVMEGVCDQSFGIHVAEMAQFPDSVVRLAKRKAAELEDFESNDSEGAAASNERKKLREETEEGLDIMKRFLKDVAMLPLEAMDHNDRIDAIMQVREKYESVDNRYFLEVMG